MRNLHRPDSADEYIRRRRRFTNPLDKVLIATYGAITGALLMLAPSLTIIWDRGKMNPEGRCESFINSMTIDPQLDPRCAHVQAEFRAMIERVSGECALVQGEPTGCDLALSKIKVSKPNPEK